MQTFQCDSNGYWHRMFLQTESHSCGMACCAMLASAYYRKHIPEDTFTGSQQGVMGYKAGVGTQSMENLADLLERQSVDTTWGDTSPSALVGQLAPHLTNSKLAIIRVEWGDKTGHFVVLGKVYPDNGPVVILDPWYGLQETAQNQLPTYLGAGTLTGNYVLAV